MADQKPRLEYARPEPPLIPTELEMRAILQRRRRDWKITIIIALIGVAAMIIFGSSIVVNGFLGQRGTRRHFSGKADTNINGNYNLCHSISETIRFGSRGTRRSLAQSTIKSRSSITIAPIKTESRLGSTIAVKTP